MILPGLFNFFRRNRQLVQLVRKRPLSGIVKNRNLMKFRMISTTAKISGIRHEESSDSEPEEAEASTYAKDLLYQKSSDALINRISNCVSIQELFNLFSNNKRTFTSEHLTQTVFVLHDLKRICEDISFSKGEDPGVASEAFIQNLNSTAEYKAILKLIRIKNKEFSVLNASYVLFYLSKLGLSVTEPLMQLLVKKVNEELCRKFSPKPAANFLKAVFSEGSLRPYFTSQRIAKKVFEEIDQCNCLHDFEDLTVCLNKLYRLVVEDILKKYTKRLEFFLDNSYITSKNYKSVLKIILFLNYPKWREKNTLLISRCMILLQNNINKLNVEELLILYDIFFKIQEPGDLLNELQRCAGNHIQKIDIVTSHKVRLLSLLMYFSSPSHRTHFIQTLNEYVKDTKGLPNLISLRQMLSYIKISDEKLCEDYWNKICDEAKDKDDFVPKLIENYMGFSTDVNNYRHKRFESEILDVLQNLVYKSDYRLFPSKLSIVLGFVLNYGRNDKSILEFLLKKLKDNWEQLDYDDCVKLASSLRLLNERGESNIKRKYATEIKSILRNIIKKEMDNDPDFDKTIPLLRSCLFMGDFHEPITKHLLLRTQQAQYITSKYIENVFYAVVTTNSLIPQVIDNICDYLVTYNNLLGFNVEKILYICFWTSYTPKNSNAFFQSAINILTRDQERLSSLTLIQSALALCFFNKLPNSLISNIFNVEFFDKLDLELANCYSKDTYPQRVRNNLMQLNRAVCLDYPESNIPWFHQKYVDQIIQAGISNRHSKLFTNRVKEYLIKMTNNPKALTENVVTPYGYHIEIVLNVNNMGDPVEPENAVSKIAVLLFHRHAFTQFLVQLKGKYSLQKRHLEMLGYRVVIVNFSDWIEKFYAEERIEYLANLIWPKDR